MQRQLPEPGERSASLSAAQVGRQRISRPCPAQVGQLDRLATLIMFAGLLRMRQLRRRHVAEGVIDLDLGLCLGGMSGSG
jgi:hypothetical protein